LPRGFLFNLPVY